MDEAEWLEADGSGGFASGTVGGERTRRYHALLLMASTPPTGRIVLVNGLEAWVETSSGASSLSTQRYTPDVVWPEIAASSVAFARTPWPCWTFTLPDGTCIQHEIFVCRSTNETVLRWSRQQGGSPCMLRVRPLLSGRDYHALHHENPAFEFGSTVDGACVSWRPYAGLAVITALSNAAYADAPVWYRSFLYTAERDRGLDHTEDLGAPGIFTFDLASADPAIIVFRADAALSTQALARASDLATQEGARRQAISSSLTLSSQSYCVSGTRGQTVIAGFPWFTDWGRDTFIAMHGLLLVTGQLDAAEAILCGWASTVSEGMLPNRFPDRGEAPEYNAVDASLWFIVAVHALLAARDTSSTVHDTLRGACEAILSGYTAGTRFGICADTDGLLRAGSPGVQLTWMDAKTGDHVVTPRIGKPVEIQALWINALQIAGTRWSPAWREVACRAQAAFRQLFANPAGGLYDVIESDHLPGNVDASLRPNQIFACGGLPFPLLGGAAAREIVDLVEAHLLTPLGLRTLSPDDPAYVGHYRGGPAERDGAYHQGTAWPWLMGPFVDAWLNVRGRTPEAKAEAASRFLPPLIAHLDEAGLGHVSEVTDGDAPHTPGGCPFQAWSLGELIRIRHMLNLPI